MWSSVEATNGIAAAQSAIGEDLRETYRSLVQERLPERLERLLADLQTRLEHNEAGFR